MRLTKKQRLALRKASIDGTGRHWPELRSSTILSLNKLGLTEWMPQTGSIPYNGASYRLTQEGVMFLHRHPNVLYDEPIY